MQLALLAEVEGIGPETADPLGVGLVEVEGVADAAVFGLQALQQAVGQVVEGDVGLHEQQAHVDKREHLAVALGQGVEAQGEEFGAAGLADHGLAEALFGIQVIGEGRQHLGPLAGQQAGTAAAQGQEDHCNADGHAVHDASPLNGSLILEGSAGGNSRVNQTSGRVDGWPVSLVRPGAKFRRPASPGCRFLRTTPSPGPDHKCRPAPLATRRPGAR